MDVKNLFDSFKDFFWDLIGYFLPGLYLIILLSYCILPERFYFSEILKSHPDLYVLVLVSLSYILGYLVYGIGLIKDKISGKRSSTRKIQERTKLKIEFLLSKELFKKYLSDNKLSTSISEDIKTRDLRNLIMPFVSKVDNKTYTFMFRSDMCKHLGNVSLCIGLLGFLDEIASSIVCIPLLFQTGSRFIFLNSILILSYFVFRETRNYFYSIALKIPFSEFSSTAKKNV